jgi:ABC-type transporter MlaC component
MLVATRLATAGRPPTAISWRVHGDGAGFRILDIVSDGKSLMATKRAEYLAVYQRSGGDIEVFIETLRRPDPGSGE